MKNRIKIPADLHDVWHHLKVYKNVERVVRLMVEKISPIKLITYTGFIRYQGEGWRIIKCDDGNWVLEVDDTKDFVYISLLL